MSMVVFNIPNVQMPTLKTSYFLKQIRVLWFTNLVFFYLFYSIYIDMNHVLNIHSKVFVGEKIICTVCITFHKKQCF